MQSESIFCFGRPIIDITASIEEKFLREINIDEESTGEIPMNKMELLLKQLSRRADYVFISAGGVECNVAINSALLGIPSSLVGTIGDDYFHLIFKDSLGFIERLDLSSMSVAVSNSAAIIVIQTMNENGERKKIKVFNYGVSEFLPWNTEIEVRLRKATMFFTSLFSANTSRTEPIWQKAVETAKALGKKVIINLGGIDTIPKERLSRIIGIISTRGDIIFSNEMESNFLRQKYDQDIVSTFSEVEFLIVTKEAKGCSIFCKGNETLIRIPSGKIPRPDEQIFEIGAGDAFCASYIFAILAGASPKQAGNFATRVSLIKIRYPESHLTRDNVNDIAMMIPIKS
ncbi:MAG: hypothetical protein COS26_00070 [Candidatus Nealsonbacteria bacterium CG02_land_8_20_14_3_00_40_11]|uniref:Carbohydrate kinase PfkB domain-containing protein n=1 Tax=Candidatus Nealsonbacteria bacterium CG02_land_8_20_14_3_00_40_11 TaxID=1974700 RepID=A0A2M7D8S1_9BACT|nr:MAG: hypothetical protein COS26_00070 [Candidatus Nealsonbacteria bacterium CG02_land_8_20_14_3_00_40_11]